MGAYLLVYLRMVLIVTDICVKKVNKYRRICNDFHRHHRFCSSHTMRAAMSAGDTPEIRLA